MKRLIKKILHHFGYKIFRNDDSELIESYYKYLFFGEINNTFKVSNYKLFQESKSQLSQDYLVASYFRYKRDGTFIEFGATNGIKDSNTYMLEKQLGWTGALVEPIKSFYSELSKNRNVICLNKVVYSENGKKINFFENEIKELSTIKGFENNDSHNRELKNSKEYVIETISLDVLIDEYIKLKEIDYLSIDTEGSEFEILKSVDLDKYKFKFISVEHNYSKNREEIYHLLTDKGYKRIMTNISKWDDYYVNTE